MKNKENELRFEGGFKYVEPPELRKAGFPPLRKLINWFAIGIGVELLIVITISVFFISATVIIDHSEKWLNC